MTIPRPLPALFVAALPLLALALRAPDADAAPRLQPPSHYLQEGPNLVAVAEALTRVDDRHVAFRRIELLSGGAEEAETPRELVLRMSPETIAEVEIGERYLLGYTRWRKAARTRGTYEEDPQGPSIVELPAIGDALLADTPAMRRLVTASARVDRRALDAVLAQLRHPATLSRRFAAGELYLRPELRQLVRQKDLEALGAILADETLDPMTHEILLRAGETLVERLGGEWLAVASRRVLERHGGELDLRSFVPSLVVTAARALGKTGDRGDVELLAKHLTSNNPGVAKAALAAMEGLDLASTRTRVAALVERSDLHVETRRVMEKFLRDHPEAAAEG